jgi:hypothetical protein
LGRSSFRSSCLLGRLDYIHVSINDQIFTYHILKMYKWLQVGLCYSCELHQQLWSNRSHCRVSVFGLLQPRCAFTFTIPSTRYFTRDVTKPQTVQYLNGYTYSGFATIQQKVDQYIFAKTLSSIGSDPADVEIMASVSCSVQVRQLPGSYFDHAGDILHAIFLISIQSSHSQSGSWQGDWYQVLLLRIWLKWNLCRMIYPNSLLSSMQLILGIKMMGMSEFDNNLSWLITTVAQMTYWCLLYRCSLQPLCLNIRTSFLYSSTLRRSVLHKSKTASLLGPITFFVSFSLIKASMTQTSQLQRRLRLVFLLRRASLWERMCS